MIKKNKAIISLCTWALLITFLLSACNTSKKTATEPTKPVTKIFSVEDYLANKIDFSSFNGRADLSITNKDGNQKVNSNIKMRKDKDIWSSILVLGGMVEVARAYITPDSLQAIVRIGKKYYDLSYEEGLRLIEADVEFPVLQNLLIGNPLMSDGKVTNSKVQDSMMLITMMKADFVQILSYDIRTHLLQKVELSSAKKDFKLVINYANYKPLALKEPFAYSRKISIKNKESDIKIDMDFTKADINIPVEISFSIPSSYTRATLGDKN